MSQNGSFKFSCGSFMLVLCAMVFSIAYCDVSLIEKYFRKSEMCPKRWVFNKLSRTCLQINRIRANFNDALVQCNVVKAELVTIKSDARNDYFSGLLTAQSLYIIWLNLKKRGNNFFWGDTNEKMTYMKNISNTWKNHSCVAISKGQNVFEPLLGWTVMNCSEKIEYVCERHLACRISEYGEKCLDLCPENCKQDGARFCNITTGNCHNCIAGFSGAKCQSPCVNNTYGENCNRTCNKNCKMTENGALCDRFFGKCLTGCIPGYQGSYCVEACVNNTYGENCNRTCNNCKMTENGAFCDRFFGKCLTGCTPGYQGTHCVEECTEKTYGENCNLLCSSNCIVAQNGSWCDRFSGQCFDGCPPGYQGPQCLEECTRGTFGAGCERPCSLNCNATGQVCDFKYGSCLHGCKPGFTGARCLSSKENIDKDSLKVAHQVGNYFLGILGFLFAFAVMLFYLGENEEDDSPKGRDSFMSEKQVPGASIKNSLTNEDNCDEKFEEIPVNETPVDSQVHLSYLNMLERLQSFKTVSRRSDADIEPQEHASCSKV